MKSLKLISVLIITLIMNLNVFAANEKLPTLTTEQASEKAINYSKRLKNLEENSSLTLDQYDEIRKNYIESEQSHEAFNLVTKLKAVTNQIDSIKASKELEKELINLNIVNFFMNLLSAEKELVLYEKTLDIIQKEIKILEVKKKLGTISELDYASQRANYENKIKEKENKEADIRTAYTSLNKVLGERLDKRYNLVLDDKYLEFIPLGTETSLSTYIIKGVNASNKLRELKKNEELKKLQVESHTSLIVGTDSLKSKEIGYAQAQRAFSEAEVSLEEGIISLYNNILKLENTYAAKLKELKKQEDNIQILEIKHKLGQITSIELENAKRQLDYLNLEIERMVFNHNIYKLKLNNVDLM